MKKFPIVLSDDPGVGRVVMCNSNCIHMTIGPVTLNLSPLAFTEAADLIRHAMEQLSKVMPAEEAATGQAPRADQDSFSIH